MYNNKKNTDNKDKINAKRRKRRLDRHTGIDWIDPENGYGKVRGEQALWRAVILQMLEDATSQSTKPNDQYHKFMAREWLLSDSKDFHMVCDLAGFDVGYLRKNIKRALLNHCKWREDSAPKPKKKAKPLELKSTSCRTNNKLMTEATLLPFHQFHQKTA